MMKEVVTPFLPFEIIENDLENGVPASAKTVPSHSGLCCDDPYRSVVIVINFIIILCVSFGSFIMCIFGLGFNQTGSPGLIVLVILIGAMIASSPFICGIYGAVNYKLWGVVIATNVHSFVGSYMVLCEFLNNEKSLTFYVLILSGFILFPHIQLIQRIRNTNTNTMTSDIAETTNDQPNNSNIS